MRDIDSYTREIIGWHVDGTHSVELVMEALQMVVRCRKKTPQLFHSDHGSEYLSEMYVVELQKHGITPSNSQKGKLWQNGAQEALHNHFKEEFENPNRFSRYKYFFEALALAVLKYNTTRIHSKLKMPPRTYHERKVRELEKPTEPPQNPSTNTPSNVS